MGRHQAGSYSIRGGRGWAESRHTTRVRGKPFGYLCGADWMNVRQKYRVWMRSIKKAIMCLGEENMAKGGEEGLRIHLAGLMVKNKSNGKRKDSKFAKMPYRYQS